MDHNSNTAHLTRNDSEEFQEVCISNAMDETDDMLCNGTEEDENVRSGCEEDEDTDCEDGDRDTDW